MDQRLKNLKQAIQTATAARQRLSQLNAQVEDLHRQRAELQTKVEETAEVFHKEQEDVENLEHVSLKALLLSLTGNKEERLDQERREALAAKCEHDQAVAHLACLEERLIALIQERDRLRQAPQQLDALWEKMAELVKDLGGPRSEKLVELDWELEQIDRQLAEWNKAVSTGEHAKHLLKQIQYDLDSARDYGTWDILGGGMIVTMAKHDRLDSAQSSILAVQRTLSEFRTQLADIRDWQVPSVEIGEFAAFADYFLDGLISDLYIQSRIKEAQEEISGIAMNLTAVLRTLTQKAQLLNDRRILLEAQRQELLTIF